MIPPLPQRQIPQAPASPPTTRFAGRQWSILGVLLFALGQNASCSHDPDRSPAFQDYMRQVTAWAPVEAETARSIQRIFASQFVDEAAVRQEVSQTIPRIKSHLDRIASVEPADPQLRDINRRYRQAWENLHQALTGLPDAIGRTDATTLAASRAALTAWGQTMIDIAAELRRARPSSPAPSE